MAGREAKKLRGGVTNGARSSTAAAHGIDYVTASRFDAWESANDEEPSKESTSEQYNSKGHHTVTTGTVTKRISHFIYSVQFNPDPPKCLLQPNMFHIVALVTAEHFIILQLSKDGDIVHRTDILTVPDQPKHSKIQTEKSENDEKKQKNSPEKNEKEEKKQAKNSAEKEDLYTLAWIKNPIDRIEWTAVSFAGSTGVIRVYDLALTPPRTGFLRGHATAVNELRYCPNHPAFLFSCSKDHTMRMWSIKYLQCLAVFGGAQGHKAEIITMDVDPTGLYLVSGSYDTCIKIWSLFGEENKKLLDQVRHHALSWKAQPVVIASPIFSGTDLHDGQIDCCRFVFSGTKTVFVISKASDETILIWIAILPAGGARVAGVSAEWQQCHRLKLTNNKFWFVKFSLLQVVQHVLALGDDKGLIKVYDLEALLRKEKGASSSVKAKQTRTGSPNKAVIRSVDFSSDGRLLIGGSDDGVCHIFVRKEAVAHLHFRSKDLGDDNTSESVCDST